MSRNLCRTNCAFCEHDVQLCEAPRLLREDEASGFFREYETMLVAEAECPACEAKYLGWVRPPTRGLHAQSPYPDPQDEYQYAHDTLYDMSFRSTFNDEPGETDLPKYRVEKRWVRIGPYEPKEL